MKKPAIKFSLILCILFWSCTNHRSGRAVTDSAVTDSSVTLIDDIAWHSFFIDHSGKTIKKAPLGLLEFLPDGNIVGRQDSSLVKMTPQMKIIWKTRVPLEIHHSISIDSAGYIYLLSSDTHHFMGLKVRFDVVRIYSPGGALVYSWCVYDHLREFMSVISRSAWLRHLPVSFERSKDIESYVSQDPARFIVPTDFDCDCDFEFTHFTSLQVLPDNQVAKKIPAFKKGNILLCFNPYSSYGILNTTSGKIEWTGYLPERTRLHSPSLTPEGTILVFQNNTDSIVWSDKNKSKEQVASFLQKIPHGNIPPDPEARRWSSVSEYDPLTGKKIWEYTATPKESLLVPHMGGAERLPNGNTLICTTTKTQGGRVFELTRDKKIVWEYISHDKDAETGLPLDLYRAKRIPAAMIKEVMTGVR
jgi:hypothetical protein